MNTQVIVVPYDSGQRGWRMGAGPDHLLRAGLAEHLRSSGHDVAFTEVMDDQSLPPAEVRTAFELMRRIAVAVRTAREAGRFPLVLAGNCSTASGTLAGLTPAARSVFWFDAHADLNTPSTTVSGYLDGMSLAIARGACYEALTATIPGFEPVDDRRIRLIATRDIDPPEQQVIDRCGIRVGMNGTPHKTNGVAYVHCDLDSLDPARVGQANLFPVPGGLSVGELRDHLGGIRRLMPIGAAAITAYAPEFDRTGSISKAAFDIAAELVHD